MIGALVEADILRFVREIISVRTGEPLSVGSRPELDNRRDKAVEELWEGESLRYAVEHTRVESFAGQIANTARVKRLLTPVRESLADRLPGYFELAVREVETTAVRVSFAFAHQEIERLILDACPGMAVGETVTLRSDRLTFDLRLRLRHADHSGLVLQSDIEGDAEILRAERFRRAFDEKCPKLATWSRDGRVSVLVLECDDFQHANFQNGFTAVESVLAEGVHRPDIIVYVETDAAPWSAWVFKDGDRLGNAAMRTHHGGYRYERGRVR
jgi:hypothetical protein